MHFVDNQLRKTGRKGLYSRLVIGRKVSEQLFNRFIFINYICTQIEGIGDSY